MVERNVGGSSHQTVPGPAPEVSAPTAQPNRRDRVGTRTASVTPPATPPTDTKDSFREVVETVVFVVVLVLLLKSFVAEAFVIPTGSMATTLYGYQKMVTCPECGEVFPVNCSSEVDPQQGEPKKVIGCVCPNCHKEISFKDPPLRDDAAYIPDPGWSTGDRVLVAKFLYDLDAFGMNGPNRFQVVVFKFPDTPQKNYAPLNYIKRLIGLPGETIAVYYGKLFRYTGDDYAEQDKDVPKLKLWRKDFEHQRDDGQVLESIRSGKFKIIRKPPAQVLSERRLVYDNDHQAKDLMGKIDPRWWPESDSSAWKVDNPLAPKRFTIAAQQGGDLAWLQYRHFVPDPVDRYRRVPEPHLVTDFMGYNTAIEQPRDGLPSSHTIPPQNWVGDLIIEGDFDIAQAQAQGERELVLELRRGVEVFQARWDLASGNCKLVRNNDGVVEELDAKPTTLRKPGHYHLRFANVDERLLVWVDSALPFGEGVPYTAPEDRSVRPTDTRPVRIGVRGADVTVTHLKLWRDTYYTAQTRGGFPDAGHEPNYSEPEWWKDLRNMAVLSMYVQPDHYLCLGDNSPESSDGRMWGLVPKRLLLGRAMLVYYPFGRAGRIE
jgi:signal peptidase I